MVAYDHILFVFCQIFFSYSLSFLLYLFVKNIEERTIKTMFKRIQLRIPKKVKLAIDKLTKWFMTEQMIIAKTKLED